MTILNSRDASRYLTISEATFQRLVKAKKIPVYRPSQGVTRFLKTDLDNYLIKTKDNHE